MAQVKEDLLVLEELVNKYGLKEVLDALTDICYEKEEGVGSAWQDESLARAWRLAGHEVSMAACSEGVANLAFLP